MFRQLAGYSCCESHPQPQSKMLPSDLVAGMGVNWSISALITSALYLSKYRNTSAFSSFCSLRNEHVVLGGIVTQNCFTVSLMCPIRALRKQKWRRKRDFEDHLWRKHRMSVVTLSEFYFNVNCSVGKE